LEEFRGDFPLAGTVVNLEREHPAETQADGPYEIVWIVFAPKLVDSLLGIANIGYSGSVAKAPGGKLGEQMTEALYGWIRRVLKRLVEDFRRDLNHVRYQEACEAFASISSQAAMQC
jgi:hypothetical protein